MDAKVRKYAGWLRQNAHFPHELGSTADRNAGHPAPLLETGRNAFLSKFLKHPALVI
jgi:hypothetical protein